MAGQGTLALEAFNRSIGDGWQPDQFLSPCGGGGLIAGCSTVVRHLSPETEVYAVEPEGFDDMARSLELDARQSNSPDARSICDALLSPTPGGLTFQVNRERVTGGRAVSDEEALVAMAVAFRYFKLIVEPGGAVALAAVLSRKLDIVGKNVIVVCSGGNTDPATFTHALAQTAPF